MPDTRHHRGPHPEDGELFAPPCWPTLQEAVAHLSWLLSRGYAGTSALKLVGDRFQLTERQRLAVMRSSCSDAALVQRHRTRLPPEALRGATVHLDGFNVLTTIEAALSGGVVLRGRDGCDRDMASMHGSYRKVAETLPALRQIGAVLESLEVADCRWLLDSPVSNSGRLSVILRTLAAEHRWPWETLLVPNPDLLLIASPAIVATADSAILDRSARWFNLAHEVIARHIPTAQVVPMVRADEMPPGSAGVSPASRAAETATLPGTDRTAARSTERISDNDA